MSALNLRKQNSETPSDWYASNRSLYENLTHLVVGTLESLIENTGIDYLSVTGRTKTLDSFLEKIERKSYKDPCSEMTDLAGVRVILFIESDIQKVCDIIQKAFNVHSDKSLDKSSELGIDRFGYRSIHFVCDLGPDRANLLEYLPYKGLLFEIQVRTVLQHAWAEIEHDRSYKFSGVLPQSIRRRLYSIASILEIADREFNDIAHKLDEYAEEVSKKAETGDLDIEINTTSLREYLPDKLANFKEIKITDLHQPIINEEIKKELENFGISNLVKLDNLINPDFLKAVSRTERKSTVIGFLRLVMMYADLPLYFEKSRLGNWESISSAVYKFLAKKYGKKKVDELFRKYSITVQMFDS